MKPIYEIKDYTYNNITVRVEIDYAKRQISLVEGDNRHKFKTKPWCFANRGLEYMNGWREILKAIEHAISEAEKLLKAYENSEREEVIGIVQKAFTADKMLIK
jgi:hypothetical protein